MSAKTLARSIGLGLGLGLLAGSACTHSVGLVASDGSHRLVAQSAQAEGIEVVLTTGDWPGDVRVTQEFTVVHVSITNLSESAIRIDPSDFEMRDERGNLYAIQDVGARSMQQIGDAQPPVDTPDLATTTPASGGHGFPVERSFLPGQELRNFALAWGDLAPRSRIRGYLYFEPVVRTGNAANLIWHSRDTDNRDTGKYGFALHAARTPPGH